MEELLNPRHPLDKYHQAQLEFLHNLPEAQRADHARMFRLGNASYRYQQQAEGEVTEDDFQHWLAGLPEKMRAAMERDGFEKCKSVLSLRRHALERRDMGYDEFVQSLVSVEDWGYEQSLRQSTEPEKVSSPTASTPQNGHLPQ
jgi:hypothetical protein